MEPETKIFIQVLQEKAKNKKEGKGKETVIA